MDIHQDIPQLLTIKTICKRLQIHPNTLLHWEKKGILIPVRLRKGGKRRYKKEDIVQLLKPKVYAGREAYYEKQEHDKMVDKSLEEWRNKAVGYSRY